MYLPSAPKKKVIDPGSNAICSLLSLLRAEKMGSGPQIQKSEFERKSKHKNFRILNL